MKYLQISTVVSYTSIGRIMRQNYDMKREQGWDCLIAYGRGSGVEGYNTIKIGTNLDCKIQGILTRLFDRHGYGSKKATRDFIKKMDEYNPNIIHLHNIHGYYLNFEILFKWLKAHPERKVIWTLHDCWAVTGHCAYFTAANCEKWKVQCLQCPQKKSYPSSFLLSNAKENFERKKKAFTGVEAMALTVPSYWMENVIKESFLNEYEIEVINNKIDANVFKPTSSNFREKYGLENKKIILGVASIWEKRKGLDDFIRLSHMLDEGHVVVLVGLSKRQIEKMPENIIGIGHIADAKKLAAIYTMADVFVNPTYEDNYPTVNLEAQACGTPVIAYDVGGTSETLSAENKENVVAVGNLEEVRKKIENILI